MKNTSFDTIVIGAGPSGMTASVYSARRGMNVLVICGEVGGHMKWNSQMDYCTGITHATLPAITEMFENHLRSPNFSIHLCSDKEVLRVKKHADGFLVFTNEGREIKSKTLIVTTGKIPRTLDVLGEEVALHGKGMSICSSSDAPLYREKKMIVIGGGDTAMDVCLQLSKLTDEVILMTDIPHLIGNLKRIQKVSENSHIVVKKEVKIHEILLDSSKKVRGVLYSQNNKKEELACTGIFREIGHTPNTLFLRDFLSLNDNREIPINRLCQTEFPGLFAAGNCTDMPHRQPIVAVGQGAIAALEAHNYLQSS